MRNRYPGTCYRCGGHVAVGGGHFERFVGRWRTQHASCAIEHRGNPDPERAAFQKRQDEIRALGTGRNAQKARKRLRDLEKQTSGASA